MGVLIMKKVVFFTKAYNAEHTIGRTIESILNQTHGNFKYCCLDNGSTDSTWRIIQEYAQKDSRIVPLHTNKNYNAYTGEYGFHQAKIEIQRHGEGGYVAFLDADDEYTPIFLEKMLAFVEENSLSMAFCGTNYIQTDGNIQDGTPVETLILSGSDKVLHLPEYYKYATRYWATLYSVELLPLIFFKPDVIGKEDLLLRRIPSPLPKKAATFYDVIRTINAIHKSDKVGILADSLHKYYQSEAQLSVAYTHDWFWWVNVMQKHLRGFIESYGPISQENENFIQLRFLVWLKYILPRLQSADAPMKTRLRDLTEIFSDNKTIAWLKLDWKAMGIHTDKQQFLEEQLAWALSQKGGSRACQINSKKLIEVLKRRLNNG